MDWGRTLCELQEAQDDVCITFFFFLIDKESIIKQTEK